MGTKVRVGLGYTRNMGNFESLRVDIAIEDDTRNDENAQQAFDRIYGKVEGLLVDKVRELESTVNEVKAES